MITVIEKGRRIFSEPDARSVIEELITHIPAENELSIRLGSWWGAGQRWARNRASLTSDQRDITLIISRPLSHRKQYPLSILATTNQIDSASLKGIGNHINVYFDKWKEKVPPDRILDVPSDIGEGTKVWSDATFDRSILENAEVVEQLTRQSESDNLMSSGFIGSTGSSAMHFYRDEWGRTDWKWGLVTQAECSVTVRDRNGNGSGWMGKTSFDINRVNIPELAAQALERCKLSLNPVRIEPGRYQVILEPQATAVFTELLMGAMSRGTPERAGGGILFLGDDRSIQRYKSKLGLKIIDERLNIFHEPSDPFFGSHVESLRRRIDLIKNGILTGMFDDYGSQLNEIADMYPAFYSTSYRMSGGSTSIEDMISSAKRAVLVARITQPEIVDPGSMLYTGVTRDGLWLIENGAITKSVRNFRWTESPLFVMNNVEEVGIEEQVFEPNGSRNPMNYGFSNSLNNVVVPPLKINDFSFTSTIDAV